MQATVSWKSDKKKVAIIDDSSADIELLKRALAASNYQFEVSSATNAYALPRILVDEQPEIVFIDYYLGEDTGANIIQSLSAEKSQVDFVVLSSRGDEDVVSEVLRAGAIDYLRKDTLSPESINAFMQRLYNRSMESLRLQSILRVTSDCILTLDSHGNIESSNSAANTLFGIPTYRLISRSIYDLMDGYSGKMLENLLIESYIEKKDSNEPVELTLITQNEETKEVEVVVNLFMLYGVPYYTAILRDITSRKSKAAQLDRQAAIIQTTSDFVGYGTTSGKMLYINNAGLTMLGLPLDYDISQLKIYDIFDKEQHNLVDINISKVIRTGEKWNGELSLLNKIQESQNLPVSAVAIRIKQNIGTDYGFAIIMRDISLEKVKEQQLRHAATHDPLTGLANRTMILEQIQHAVNDSARYNKQIALLYLDLDNFKGINDTLGHKAGDEILKVVSHRLATAIRNSDLAARIGGDEFVILMEHIRNAQPIALLAERLIELIGAPIPFQDHELFVTPSIGIALYPESGTNAENLLQCADSAMYMAKRAGRNRYNFYSKELQQAIVLEEQIKSDLLKSLQKKEFFLEFQPIYDINRSLCAYECLVRWNHPEKGLISPLDFIPIAEQSGLIFDLGDWIIASAIPAFAKLNQSKDPNVRLSINISPVQLRDNKLLHFLSKTVKANNIDPQSIILEITESALIGNMRTAGMILNNLAKKGFRLAMDDFGTAYASLKHLQQLPVSIIKIDKVFIKNIGNNKKQVAILKSMISMAAALDIETIIEGIEKPQEWDFCQNSGAKYFQGFFLSIPKPLSELIKKEKKKTA